jgi:hypothetical protein
MGRRLTGAWCNILTTPASHHELKLKPLFDFLDFTEPIASLSSQFWVPHVFLESNFTDTDENRPSASIFLFCFSLVDNDNTPSSRRQVRASGLLDLVTAV